MKAYGHIIKKEDFIVYNAKGLVGSMVIVNHKCRWCLYSIN